MGLLLIRGSSGSGKSTCLYKHVIGRSIRHPDRRCLVIVPEQYTMQVQRDIVRMHPDHVILNIDVLSFERLAMRVLEEAGRDTGEILGNTGKNLILRRVCEENEDRLTVLKGLLRRPGYISEIRSLLSEFRQYMIVPGDLPVMGNAEGLGGPFQKKMADLAVIYSAFEDYTASRFVTTEDELEMLLSLLPDSAWIRGSYIALDGFTGFTPVQKDLVHVMLDTAAEVAVTVTIRPEEALYSERAEEDLFYMPVHMARTLLRIEEDSGRGTPDVIETDAGKGRLRNSRMLFHLEENLFRDRPAVLHADQDGEDAVEIWRLPDTRRELSFAAGRIRELVRTEGRHYGDFAIVTGSLEDYRVSAEEIFKAYGIPLFTDYKEDLSGNPLSALIHGLFRLVRENWSYRSVMEILRSGIAVLPAEDADLLDLYLAAAGIRGKKAFTTPFRRKAKRYTDEDLKRLNEIRKAFLTEILPFTEALSNAGHDPGKIASALEKTLSDLHAENFLSEKAADFETQGSVRKARLYGSLWESFRDIIDQMTQLLSGEEVTPDEFEEILDAAFESVRVGAIPETTDCVILGDIERTRLDEKKILFVLGVNDGIIPAADTRGGILSETEREILKEDDFELAPTARERSFRQRFYLYMVLTKPEEKLILTFRETDPDGRLAHPSYLVKELQKLFPFISVKSQEDLSLYESAQTERILRSTFVRALRKAADDAFSDQEIHNGRFTEAGSILAWYRGHAPEVLRKTAEDLTFLHRPEKLTSDLSFEMTGGRLNGSVSLLETYAACAYSYFLKYGLGLAARQEYAFDSADIGSLYHDALKRYADDLAESDADWFTVTPEERQVLLDHAVDEAYSAVDAADLSEDPKTAFRLSDMKRTLSNAVELMTAQVRRGNFVPEAFEVDFRQFGNLEALTAELSDAKKIRFRGQIDRIDALRIPEKNTIYLKIIDYKSGTAKPDPGETAAGLQIQLFLYMRAAMEGIQKKEHVTVKPGAVYYYHVRDGMTEDHGGADEAEALLDAMKQAGRDGVVNGDEAVLVALDTGNPKSRGSAVIPSESAVLTEQEFEDLLSSVQETVKRELTEIEKGTIEAQPYRKGDRKACDYCEYHAVCGFEPDLRGFSYREIPEKMTWKEVCDGGRSTVDRGSEEGHHTAE